LFSQPRPVQELQDVEAGRERLSSSTALLALRSSLMRSSSGLNILYGAASFMAADIFMCSSQLRGPLRREQHTNKARRFFSDTDQCLFFTPWVRPSAGFELLLEMSSPHKFSLVSTPHSTSLYHVQYHEARI
jgi:hypothetical protein